MAIVCFTCGRRLMEIMENDVEGKRGSKLDEDTLRSEPIYNI